MKLRRNICLFLMLCESVLAVRFVQAVWGANPILYYSLAICFFLASIPIFLLNIWVVETTEYLLRGYAVYMPTGPEPPVFYKERGKGKIEFYTSPESDENGRFLMVHIPSIRDWNKLMPDWAAARRSKIVARIKAELSWDESIRFDGGVKSTG